jgi:hypothetical protein
MRFKANKGINRKTKVAGILTILLFVFIGLFQLGIKIAEWFDGHKIIRQQVIQLQVQAPLRIETRETQVVEIVQVIKQIPEYDELTDIEKYICDVWGPADCKIAVAVARAESGLREDAVNIWNSNGTYDTGIFQVNSIHQSKEGCSLKDLVDAKKNIDCAKKIHDASGWNAWSAFNSGAFKNKLD